MNTILNIQTWDEFGVLHTIGLCTTPEKAERLIKKYIKQNYNNNNTIIKVDDTKFKIPTIKNGEEYDFWIKPIKVNKLI